MNAVPYDFRKPSRLAVELEQELGGWFAAAGAMVPERWAKHLSISVEHSLSGIETVRAGAALSEWETAAVAYRIAVGPAGLQTLSVFPRPLILGLIAGMLGDPCLELPADRALTAVEDSLAEYLLQRFLQAYRESWPLGDPLDMEIRQGEPVLKRIRIAAPEDSLVRCTSVMRGPFGEQSWQWLWPQDGLTALLRRAEAAAAAPDQGLRGKLEAIVGEMPLQVTVRLGSAELHVSELVGMRIGDVVILDQLVSRPLTASVAGKARFQVWPGRVGAKQAFQIESLVEC